MFTYFQAEKEWHLRLYEEAIKEVRANKGGINREVTRSRCCGWRGGGTKTLNRLCQKPRSREKIRRNTSTPVNPQGRRGGGGEQGKFAP